MRFNAGVQRGENTIDQTASRIRGYLDRYASVSPVRVDNEVNQRVVEWRVVRVVVVHIRLAELESAVRAFAASFDDF